MKYKYISPTVLKRIDDDGISRLSCSIENEDYVAWLAEGNIPEPADPPTNDELNSPIYENLYKIDLKSIRALRDNDPVWIKKYKDEADAERAKLKK